MNASPLERCLKNPPARQNPPLPQGPGNRYDRTRDVQALRFGEQAPIHAARDERMTCQCITRMIILSLILAAIPVSPLGAQGRGSPQPVAATQDNQEEEGWSFDDIKDVFEAIHFLAITLGIGVGIWWFLTRYLSQSSALSLDLEVTRRARTQGGQLIEILATIRNDGINGSHVDRCLVSIAAIDADVAASRPGLLREGEGLTPVVEEALLSKRTLIAAGTSLRLATVLALPGNVSNYQLSARLHQAAGQPPLIAKRLDSQPAGPT